MPKGRVEEQIRVRNPVAEIVLKVYGPRPAHLQPSEVAEEMERLGIDLEDHPTWGHPDWWTPQRIAHEKALATEYAFKREIHFDDQGWPTVAYLRQWAADEAAFRTTLAAKQAKVVRAVSVGYAHAVALRPMNGCGRPIGSSGWPAAGILRPLEATMVGDQPRA